MCKIRRYGYGVVLCLFFAVFLQGRAVASALHTDGSTRVSVYGFLDYEGGFCKHFSSSFYRSNTSYKYTSSIGTTTFYSRSQVRFALDFKNADTKTSAKIMVDSWPEDFQLELAYVKHSIGKHCSITFGKDWSLVNQRYFHFSSFVFKPYAAGFQGSKRTPQITFKYIKDMRGNFVSFALGVEDRNSKDGIVVGKNIMFSGNEISYSNISSFVKVAPAFVGQIVLGFKTGFGAPSNIMAYYEAMPIYLECKTKKHKETAYLYSIAGKLHINRITLIGQYLHTLGFSGIAGITGNSLKTFSYIYTQQNIIKRQSNTFGVEIAFKPIDSIDLAAGYVDLNFFNHKTNDNYFLKNEVKNVKTIYVSGIFNITKLTKLFIEWDNIKTKYAIDNSMSGNFHNATGSQLFFGYRMYF